MLLVHCKNSNWNVNNVRNVLRHILATYRWSHVKNVSALEKLKVNKVSVASQNKLWTLVMKNSSKFNVKGTGLFSKVSYLLLKLSRRVFHQKFQNNFKMVCIGFSRMKVDFCLIRALLQWKKHVIYYVKFW